MHPLLRPGDLLFILEIPPRRIKIGELICFYKKGTFVCHRLIYKRVKDGKLLFFEKADNARVNGSYIDPGTVIGKAVKILRGEKEIKLKERLIKRYTHVLKTLFLKSIIYVFAKKKKMRRGEA